MMMRANSLKHLKLKAVIKESHCSPVQDLNMNMCDGDCRNLFATAAKDQATIYDDMHMGDNIAVVANLALSNTLEDAKDTFNACCWIRSAELTQHPYGDALLAVGGSDPYTHIISVVEAAVVGQLPLPAGASVAELLPAASCPGVLLVLCRDGTLQLWQISTGTCLWQCKTDAFTAAIHPHGTCVLTCSRNGKISRWDLQGLDLSAAAASTAAATSIAGAAVSKQAWVEPHHSESPVDCIRFLADDRVATKTCDGRMAVYSWPSGKLISSWKVPGSGGSSSTPSYSKRCCFGHTKDGQYICIGNQAATAYVYDATTGRQMTRVEAIRVQGTVRACGLSEDCRHLVMVVGHGYVFRFECRPPADKETEEGEDEDGQMEVDVEGAAGEAADTAAVGPGALQAADYQQEQEQEQQQLPPLPGAQQQAGSTPLTAAGAEASAQWQRQQQQHTPSDCAGTAAASFGEVEEDMLQPRSGSLEALLRVEASPATADDGTAGASGLQQQSGTSGLSGEAGQTHNHKKQRLAQAGDDDSPLVFRPTPRKQ